MRKIPEELDNPIDNIIVDRVEDTVGFFRDMGFTPNGITTLSLLTGLLSIYLLYQGKFIEAAICYAISYFFDCMDGYMARKYKMVSKFGDIYDHIKDNIVGGLLVIFLGQRYLYSDVNLRYAILIIPFLLYTTSVQMGCQEIYNDNIEHKSDTLSMLESYCPGDTQKDAAGVMRTTRYLGSGTLILTICVLIILCKYL